MDQDQRNKLIRSPEQREPIMNMNRAPRKMEDTLRRRMGTSAVKNPLAREEAIKSDDSHAD